MQFHINPLTPRVKPHVIKNFLTFDSMDRTLKCDHLLEAVEQYFAVCFSFSPVCNCWKIYHFGLDSVRSERFKG